MNVARQITSDVHVHSEWILSSDISGDGATSKL